MSAKSILIKTHSKELSELLTSELDNLKNVKFFSRKINGLYILTIKCNNYYSYLNLDLSTSFYKNYIFLYSTTSIILSELLIKFYEEKLANRFLYSQYFYFPKKVLTQLTNISSLVLSEELPDYKTNELYLIRKEILLQELLDNFKKRNYLTIESFINFSAPLYHETLEYILSTSIQLILSNQDLFHWQINCINR